MIWLKSSIVIDSGIGNSAILGLVPEMIEEKASALNVSVGIDAIAMYAIVRTKIAVIRRHVLPRSFRHADRRPREWPEAAAGKTKQARVKINENTITPIPAPQRMANRIDCWLGAATRRAASKTISTMATSSIATA